jgi:Holliday junction resolvase RusA-like endonuclease
MMTADLHFIVPGSPVPKERPRIGKGRTYTPARTRAYEAKVRLCAQAAASRLGWRIWPGQRYSVNIYVVFQDQRRRDLDNACKSIADAMRGIGFFDDSEIDEVHLYRGISRTNPRAIVAVRVLEPL